MRDEYDFSQAKRGAILSKKPNQAPDEIPLSDEEQLEDIKEMLAAREEALLQAREQKARQDIAKKMLEIGEPPEKVATLTGLSLEDIQKIQ